MTQHPVNGVAEQVPRRPGGGAAGSTGTSGQDPGDRRLDDVLSGVRQHCVEFLAQVPRLPRALRVCAGDVSIDVEWDESESSDSAPPMPTDDVRPTAEAVGTAYVRSPSVGVYYEASEPGAAPFVRTDDLVLEGQQLAYVEVMKLLVRVDAERSGRIVAVLKENGESVEYGEPLFVVDPTDADEASDV